MPFRYEFKLNNNKISGVEIGFSTSRKWEEALDEAKLSLPFLTSSTPLTMYGLIQIEIIELDANGDEVEVETHDMLIISDRVAPSTKYGFYRHDINAIEYTAKLDAYIMASLAKSRIIINENPAPFDIIEELNFSNGVNTFRTFVNVEGINVRSTYYANQQITFEQVAQAYQATNVTSASTSEFRRADVYLTTNATLVSGTKPFNLSSGDCTWVLPKGKWYIDYQVDVLNADISWAHSDGLHTLYRFYINVVDEISMTMYDVVETIRNSVSSFGGIESERYHAVTRLFEIDTNVADYLKGIEAPQMYLANATARQMLIFALSFVNSIPRLLYGESMDTLTIEKYNDVQGEFTAKDLGEYSGSQNTNQIGSRSYSALNQVLPDDLRKANIFSPSQSGYQSVRSSMTQITANNFQIKLPKPIYQPVALYVLIDEVKIKGLYGTDPRPTTVITNLDLPLTARWINIEEWRLKNITDNFPTITTNQMWNRNVALRENMVANLYWQQGDSVINLSDIYGSIFQSNLIKNVVREAVYEYFMRNMTEPFFKDIDEMIDEYEITFTMPSDSEYQDWRFRIEYISDESLVVKHDKEDLSQINFYSEMKHNQDESIINIVRASRKIYGDLQRTGNQNYSFTKYHKTLGSMYKVGQKDVNGYTISSITKEYHNEYIIATYYITRYHNRIQQATFVDQTYRWRDNYAKQVLDRHENYGDYVILLPPDDGSTSNQNYTKITSNEVTIQTLLDIILGASPPTKTKATNAIIRTDGIYEVTPESDGWRYAISTPVSSYGLKGSLAFTFGFKGNQVAGDGLIIVTGNTYNKAVRYTNEQGRFTKFGFWILRDLIFGYPSQYPTIENEMTVGLPNGLFDEDDEYFGCGDLTVSQVNYLGDDPMIVEKDPLTNFSLTYQLSIMSYYVGLYVIGINFYTKNFLVNNPNGDEKAYLHIYTNGERYEMFEDIYVKDGASSVVQLLGATNIIYNPSLNNVRFTLELPSNMTSWAIGNHLGELLIACNEPLGGFDLVNRHFRPNIVEIGAKPSEIKLSETVLLDDEMTLSQFIFPILTLEEGILMLSTWGNVYQSTDYVLNLATDNIQVQVELSAIKSTNYEIQTDSSIILNDNLTLSQFVFPIIDSLDDGILFTSTYGNVYQSTNYEEQLSGQILMYDDFDIQTSTDVSLSFGNDVISLISTPNVIQSTNLAISLVDTAIALGSTLNSEASTDITTSLSSDYVYVGDDIQLVQSTNITISSLDDSMTFGSTISSEKSTNFSITLTDTAISLTSSTNVLLPKVWVYVGTSGTYNLAVTNIASGGSCSTQSAILAWLNTNYPPENYANGYKVRVFRTNEEMGLCSPSYYYYEIQQ